MKKWWNAFWMCFGMFCVIPCPVRVWDEQARPRMIACLPLTGGVIGGLWAAAAWGLNALGAPRTVWAACMSVTPWLLSGFIHLDGYLDCWDAIFSRRDLETRQKILKDSHTGAFALIGMAVLALFSYGLWGSVLASEIAFLPLIFLPVAVRSGAALAVTLMKPMARSQYAGGDKTAKKPLALPSVCLICAAVLPVLLTGRSGLAPGVGAAVYGLAARYGARQLGGISGDVSGFALTVGELAGAAALVLL